MRFFIRFVVEDKSVLLCEFEAPRSVTNYAIERVSEFLGDYDGFSSVANLREKITYLWGDDLIMVYDGTTDLIMNNGYTEPEYPQVTVKTIVEPEKVDLALREKSRNFSRVEIDLTHEYISWETYERSYERTYLPVERRIIEDHLAPEPFYNRHLVQIDEHLGPVAPLHIRTVGPFYVVFDDFPKLASEIESDLHAWVWEDEDEDWLQSV